MKNILFISHGNSLSGAPLVLLYFMQWLRENYKEYKLDLLVLNEGKLSDDFKIVANNYYSIKGLEKKIPFQKQLPFFLSSRLNKFLQKRFMSKIKNNNYHLIYANTVASLKIAEELKKDSESQLILHVHEMDTVINQVIPKFRDVEASVDIFIAASELVKHNLIKKWDIDSDKIKRVYEFSRIEKIDLDYKKQGEDFVVCGCGYVDWRKGTDIFIQVARHLVFNKNKNRIKFIWIGKISQEDRLIIEADIEKMGLMSYVSFVGEQLKPHEILKKCRVFLLPPREDPFPLVCIETAMFAKPIICFENATGIAEILIHGGGFIAPYLDIEKMADKVEYYMNNSKELRKDGIINQQNFSNFTPNILCPEIFDFIN